MQIARSSGRRRGLCFAIAGVLMAVALGTRMIAMPAFVVLYVGDVLWAMAGAFILCGLFRALRR